MNRTVDAGLSGRQLAFWGYINDRGADAAQALAYQLRLCKIALNGRAKINRFFYETPGPISDFVALAVRGAGGPSHHDGGWDDLAAVLPVVGRGFDAIICSTIDRLGRRYSRAHAREQLAANHGITILAADEPMPGPAETCVHESAQIRRRAWSVCVDGAVESIAGWSRRCACG
jgi:hypothetical protein